jgi:hypothetical protein
VLLETLMDDATAARAHFHVWWSLRHIALPEFRRTMSDYSYVDFFHASNAGHYKLIFIALAKIFDRSNGATGLKKLAAQLRRDGRPQDATLVDELESRYSEQIKRIMAIRNKSIGHNEMATPRHQVYRDNPIAPNQIRELIDAVCALLNTITRRAGNTTVISDPDRYERAVLAMLKRLRDGET